MIIARRELLATGAALAGVCAVAADLRIPVNGLGVVETAKLAPPGTDVLLLHGGGVEAAMLAQALRAREGATQVVERQIALLGRPGFAHIAALLDRARHVQVVACADHAQLLALEVMIARAGAVARTVTTGRSVLMTARF